MVIRIFVSSQSGSRQIWSQQNFIKQVLDASKIEYETIEVTTDPQNLITMRRLANNDKVTPPQIFNGDIYCGNYEDFSDAVEIGKVEEFLKL
ncbi:hypothetical protein HZS_7246 [Henneguya salminicola]|nr:hypothetical protein HZS_7246 [Henneguya salminicola]